MKPEYWDRAKRALARRDPVLAGIMRRHPRVHLVARGEPFQTLGFDVVIHAAGASSYVPEVRGDRDAVIPFEQVMACPKVTCEDLKCSSFQTA